MSDFTKEQIHGCFMVTSYMGGNLWPFNGLKHRKTEANEGSIVSPSEGSQGINTPWKTIEARERKHFPFLKYGPSWRVYLISKTSTSKKFQIHHQKVPLKRKPGISEASSISTTTRSPSYIILVGRVAHCQARPCQLLQMLAAQRRWCSSWVRGILAVSTQYQKRWSPSAFVMLLQHHGTHWVTELDFDLLPRIKHLEPPTSRQQHSGQRILYPHCFPLLVLPPSSHCWQLFVCPKSQRFSLGIASTIPTMGFSKSSQRHLSDQSGWW